MEDFLKVILVIISTVVAVVVTDVCHCDGGTIVLWGIGTFIATAGLAWGGPDFLDVLADAFDD